MGGCVVALAACGPKVGVRGDASDGAGAESIGGASTTGSGSASASGVGSASAGGSGSGGESTSASVGDDENEIGEGRDCGCCRETFHLAWPDAVETIVVTLEPVPADWDAYVVACPAGTVTVDGEPDPNAEAECTAEGLTLRTRVGDIGAPKDWSITLGDGRPFDALASCRAGRQCDCDGCGEQLCELMPVPDTGTTGATTGDAGSTTG
jgi:hypothetical protein